MTFEGIHFDEDHPYSPREAMQLLIAAMVQIRKSDRLRDIGIEPSLPGRDRIKEEEEGAWDVVRLRGTGEGAFNESPHYTLSIRPEEVLAVLILPNRWLAGAAARTSFKALGSGSFQAAIGKVTENLTAVIGSSKSARPWILLQQRRATRGQQLDIRDSRIEFDPQTAVGPKTKTAGHNEIKPQPQWLRATFSALANKSSNIEMCIGARFLYGDEILRTPALVDRVIDSWAACRPLLDAVLAVRV